MKPGWVALIALLTLVAGFFGGAMFGSIGGVVGGSVAGICQTADVAVKEGLLTDAQRMTLLQAMSTKYSDSAKKIDAKGDLAALCKDLGKP